METPKMISSNKFPGFDNVHETDLGKNKRKFSPEDRYKYSLLEDQNGNKFFSKKVPGIDLERDRTQSRYLSREAVWAQFAKEVGDDHPELHFTSMAPLHVEKNDDGYVTQLVYPYINAPFVAETHDASGLRSDESLKRYVDIMLATDDHAKDWQVPPELDNRDEHTPYNHLDKSWESWLVNGGLLEHGVVTEDMTVDARGVIQNYSEFVEPRFQHGDYTPWHLFSVEGAHGSSSWISFYGEHASAVKPRYYDLAYSYSRIYTRCKDGELASMMLRDFVERGSANGQFTIEGFEKAFIPVLLTRSMGMLLDAHNDRLRIDYFAEARELFDKTMSQKIDDLL